jgi:sugar phosphate isomerase/epimerase
VSVQLYTVRDAMGADLAATLRKVAEIGYKNVELAGFAGVTAGEFKKLLTDLGLKAPSAHVGIDQMSGDALGKTIDDYAAVDCKKLVVPYLTPDWRKGGEGYAKVAETLNEIGSKLKSQGFELGYHNHAFEFEDTSGGKTGMEQLLAGTSPDLVKFEVDTYWVLHAGVDPVKFVMNNFARINMLHLKDMDAGDRSFAPVGTGSLPLDGLLAVAESAPGIAYVIVEQDQATKQTPIEAIEISYKTLRAKGYE